MHSLAIQADLKSTGAGAFSPQLWSSLIGHLPLPPTSICSIVNLSDCFPISSSIPPFFPPFVFHIRHSEFASSVNTQESKVWLNQRLTCAHAAVAAMCKTDRQYTAAVSFSEFFAFPDNSWIIRISFLHGEYVSRN